MRVPGTINFPDEGKRKKGRVKVQAELIQFNHDLVYPLSAFQQAGPPANADVTLDIGEPQSIATPAELDSMVTRKVKGWDKDLANAKAWQQGWKAQPIDAVDWQRVNVSGSSIAIGHPWCATGGRIVTTLAYEMARRDVRYGLVSIFAAGAMAGAFLLERDLINTTSIHIVW